MVEKSDIFYLVKKYKQKNKKISSTRNGKNRQKNYPAIFLFYL